MSYEEARKLALTLGLNTISGLKAIFRDLEIGKLELSVGDSRIEASLLPKPGTSSSQAKRGFELEKGLIDGALELITGVPVTTSNRGCAVRGQEVCRFEAALNYSNAEDPRFVPYETGREPGLEACCDGDPPLGLRSWYVDLAARELARARRHQRPLTLLYIDLDDLGEINRRLGRRAGDNAIGAAAVLLGNNCRTEDIIWHNGEDEFVVLLMEAGLRRGASAAKRLIAQISTRIDANGEKVKASIGSAAFPRDGEDINSLLSGARNALYLAKADGKGRWRHADSGGKTQGSPEEGGVRSELQTRPQTVIEEPSEHQADKSPAPAETGYNHSGGSELLKGASIMAASVSPLIITGMRQMIAGVHPSHTDGLLVAEIADPASLPRAVADMRPDLIFADMQMAMFNDFALPRMIRDENLPCKIVAYLSEVDAGVIKLASDFSVNGMILQTTPLDQTVALLDRIYQGKSFLPDEVRAAINELAGSRRLLSDLSDRELEVLRLVSEGKSNSQISEQLFITINTVRFHLANVYQKLGVSNRTEAANYYLRQGLPSLDK